MEKARAKQAARLARLAAKDPDDDEDEEDEDEEEPDAEDLPPPPKHPMTIEGEALMAECLGNFDLLATKPAPASFESNSLLAAVGASIGEPARREGIHSAPGGKVGVVSLERQRKLKDQEPQEGQQG